MPEAAKEIKTEDIKKETLEQLVDDKEESLNNEPNPVETKAREKGWKPLEEFDGDPETFVPAKEYVEREPLYKALHKANREIKKMKETFYGIMFFAVLPACMFYYLNMIFYPLGQIVGILWLMILAYWGLSVKKSN